MQRLSPAWHFKAETGREGTFSGHASVFGTAPDSFGDVIQAGAFGESLKKHQERGTWPPLLWAHNPAAPIGRWAEIKEDSRGLAVSGRLSLGTTRGAEVYELLKDGAASGLSIGYNLPPDGVTSCSRGECVLKKIDLIEVSIVTIAAQPEARIEHVKSGCGSSIPEIQRFLQDSLGVSRSRARKMAFSFSQIMRGVDEDGDGEDLTAELSHEISSITQLFQRT